MYFVFNTEVSIFSYLKPVKKWKYYYAYDYDYVDFAVTFVILAIDIDTYTFNNIWEIIIIGNQYS